MKGQPTGDAGLAQPYDRSLYRAHSLVLNGTLFPESERMSVAVKFRIPWRIRSFRRRLFVVYSTLIIAVLLAAASVFYAFYRGATMDQMAAEQSQLSAAIISASDAEVAAMDTVSMNIFYSNLVETHLRRYMLLSAAEDYQERLQTQQALTDILWAVIGPFQTVSQVNIYDLEGHMIGAGLYNQKTVVRLEDKDWYERTRLLDGSKNLTGPRPLEYIDATNYHFRDRSFLSLSRYYKDGTLEAKGIIEVLQDCSKVFSYLNSMRRYHPNAEFFVVDGSGHYIYPYNGSPDGVGRHYYGLIAQERWEPQTAYRTAHPESGRTQIITHASSDYTGWTVIVASPSSVVYQPLIHFTWIFLGLGLGMLLITLVVSFVVSGTVTGPLADLQEAIAGMDITTLRALEHNDGSERENLRTSLDELQAIDGAFRAMQQELNQAVSQLVSAKTQEAQAKLLALQSQMDPHFLYNNLATIQAMADAGMQAEIAQFTKDMSSMLRYIAEEAEHGVPLAQEIRYVETYLRLMKIRLQDNLTYTVDIPETMDEIPVPKLLVQPLVENSIKHGFSGTPPWHLTIRAWLQAATDWPESVGSAVDTASKTTWLLSVTDNGRGFSPEVLAELNQALDQVQTPYDTSQLSLDGMGLMNTYLRLKLLYHNEAVFQLENNADGGATMTIGGPLPAQEGGNVHGTV